MGPDPEGRGAAPMFREIGIAGEPEIYPADTFVTA